MRYVVLKLLRDSLLIFFLLRKLAGVIELFAFFAGAKDCFFLFAMRCHQLTTYTKFFEFFVVFRFVCSDVLCTQLY